MVRNQLSRILHSEDKGVSKTSGANGVLARLWRQMLLDLNVGPAKYGDYMHDFVTDMRNGIGPVPKDQTTARGNITKEFARPQITWKVYMKALRFLKAIKVEFAVKVYYENGSTSHHATAVDFGTRLQLNQFLASLEVEDPVDDDEETAAFNEMVAFSTMLSPKHDQNVGPTDEPVAMTADLYEARTLLDGRVEPVFTPVARPETATEKLFKSYRVDNTPGSRNYDYTQR